MSGLGALYSRASMYFFGDWNKCGEVMGLAPYGRPDRIKKLVWLEDGELVAPDWDASFDKPWVDEDGAVVAGAAEAVDVAPAGGKP